MTMQCARFFFRVSLFLNALISIAYFLVRHAYSSLVPYRQIFWLFVHYNSWKNTDCCLNLLSAIRSLINYTFLLSQNKDLQLILVSLLPNYITFWSNVTSIDLPFRPPSVYTSVFPPIWQRFYAVSSSLLLSSPAPRSLSLYQSQKNKYLTSRRLYKVQAKISGHAVHIIHT